MYIQFSISKAIEHQAGSQNTQRSITTDSYKKVAKRLQSLLADDAKVLDYGAGLCEGTAAMRSILTNMQVESYEMFPTGKAPDHISVNTLAKDYDAIVCLNVLNVLEPDLRKKVAKDILKRVKKGGCFIIGTRRWKHDIDTTKNFEEAKEPYAIWVLKKEGKVYQKGFEGNELLEYLQSLGGDAFEMNRLNGIAKTTVIGKKV